MGFYGNISNTSKTNFSFDLIYNSRVQMEDAMETDGVFLGRYILIQYDTPPVQAYYNNNDGWMYNSPTFNYSTRLNNPTKGQLYQDIGNMNSIYGFYYYNGNAFEGIQTVNETSTPYAFYFRKDVSAYGRGYDATVWMKQFDPNNGKYKYVMTAELNAVVPTFHLVLDPPSEAPIAPYFDRDTTNINYYLHQQPHYGMRIGEAEDEDLSDEDIRRKKINWKVDYATGMQVWEESNQVVAGDIFYNKPGFDYVTRVENTKVRDEINYDYVESGRVYGGDPDSAVYDENKTAPDTYEWRFRLPAIGNSICYMWDKVYGTQKNQDGTPINGKRFINVSQQLNDTAAHSVTYDKTTLMGMVNTARDLLGYHFLPKASAPGATIYNSAATISYSPPAQNGITWTATSYKALDCLYYELDANGAVSKYYYYSYAPTYAPFTGTALNSNTTYYIADGASFKLANVGLWKAQDANGTNLPAQNLYTRTDAWKLTELEHGPEDGVYAILANLHSLLGTNAEDERSLTSIQGTINSMKDLLSSINPDLKPGRLLHTNVSTGQIEVTNTYFPGSDDDETRVLAGTGEWVNRLNSMTITTGTSTSAANLVVPNGEQVLDASNDHDNNIDVTTGNKWIRIAGNPTTNVATFGHLVQTIPNTTAELVNYNNTANGEEFSTQVVTWDEAGHIIGAVTTPRQLPMSYKTISAGANSTEVNPVTNTAKVVADTTLDELQLTPGNKWVNIAAYDAEENGEIPDTIKFSHVLSGVTAGSYGLATDETITSLNTDNVFEVPYITVDEAGHITKASTETVTIPENFEQVTLTVAEDNAVGELTAKAGSFKPTTLTDTFNLATANKWIRANADTEGRKISLAHRLTSVEGKTGTAINQNNSDKFNVYDFDFDQAGHVIAKTTTEVTIPNAYKQFTVGAVANVTTDLAGHAAGDCTPDAIKDVLSFYPGNKWMRIAANRAGANSAVDDAITFGHSVYYDAPQESVSTAETPKFGATFSVPHFVVDEAGHVNNIASHTVQIPLPSLSGNNDAGNLVTSVSLAQDTGAITIGRADVGSLALGDNYTSAAEAPTDKNVSKTDSVNTAIQKLEQQVIDEIDARTSQVSDEAKARQEADTALGGKIDTEISDRKAAITQEVSDRNTAIDTAIKQEVSDRNTAITTAINGLVDGAPDALNTLKELSDALSKGDSDLSGTITNLKTTVDNHIANYENPHKVTANQIDGLSDMINTAIQAIFNNCDISLKEPEAEVVVTDSSVAVNVLSFADTTTIRWEKQLDSGEFAVTDSAPVGTYSIEATSNETAGTYKYYLIREYLGQTKEFESLEVYTLTYTEPTPEPEIPEEEIPTE